MLSYREEVPTGKGEGQRYDIDSNFESCGRQDIHRRQPDAGAGEPDADGA